MVFGHFKTKHPTSFCVLRMFRWSSCEWSMVNASQGWSHCHGCQVDLLWLTALKLMFSFDRRVTEASHLTSRLCPCPVAFFLWNYNDNRLFDTIKKHLNWFSLGSFLGNSLSDLTAMASSAESLMSLSDVRSGVRVWWKLLPGVVMRNVLTAAHI